MLFLTKSQVPKFPSWAEGVWAGPGAPGRAAFPIPLHDQKSCKAWGVGTQEAITSVGRGIIFRSLYTSLGQCDISGAPL
jgi:hypothetical protein